MYVEMDRKDKNIADIFSAIDSASHAVTGVSLTSAGRHNKLYFSVTRSEHHRDGKRHACLTKLICLIQGTRRSLTIVLCEVLCPRFQVLSSEDLTQSNVP